MDLAVVWLSTRRASSIGIGGYVATDIHENVEAGSKLYTDSGTMYKGLDSHYDREWGRLEDGGTFATCLCHDSLLHI